MASPVEKLVRGYLDHLTVERGASPHTVAAYRRDLAKYVAFLAGRGIDDPAAVTEADVAAFLAALQSPVEGRPLSVTSATRSLVAVRSLHAFAAAEGRTAENPAIGVRPPKAGRRLPKALDIAQVQALLDTPDTDTPAGLRDAALLELLYGTGARISEILDLDVDDVTRRPRRTRTPGCGCSARDARNDWSPSAPTRGGRWRPGWCGDDPRSPGPRRGPALRCC